MMILKEFSRIVCVSLFSYQGSLFVCLSDSSFILSHLKSFVKHFFQLFSNSFLMNLCLADSLFNLPHPQAFVNKFFYFFEKFIFFKKINGEGGIWTLAPR